MIAGRLLPLLILIANGPALAQVVANVPLNVERRGHTATQLQDGKILVIGGENASGPVSQAEIFDTNSQTFSLAADSTARTDHTVIVNNSVNQGVQRRDPP